MNEIENDFIKLWIENNIVYGRYKPNTVVDLSAATKIVNDRLTLSNGRDYPTLSFIDDLKSVSKEARDFFSKGDGIKHMEKLALLTRSPISKMLGNFWLQISKPTVATRLFTSETDAINWLKEK
jgi:hypothetical protein